MQNMTSVLLMQHLDVMQSKPENTFGINDNCILNVQKCTSILIDCFFDILGNHLSLFNNSNIKDKTIINPFHVEFRFICTMQTVKTQIRGLLQDYSDQGLHCLQKTSQYCAYHVLVQPNLCDFIFTSCPIKLKLTSIISTFQTNSGTKFHSNPTTGKEFPHRHPL